MLWFSINLSSLDTDWQTDLVHGITVTGGKVPNSMLLQVPQVDIERLEPSIIEQHQARAEDLSRQRAPEKDEVYTFDPQEGFEDITMKGTEYFVN